MTSLLAVTDAHAGHVAFPILTSLILLPIAGAVVVALTPRNRPELAKMFGLLFSIATAAAAVAMLLEFKTGVGGYQFVTKHSWISSVGVSWNLGIDGISLFLVVLSALLFPIAIVGPNVHKDIKQYAVWMLVLEAGCIGSFVSLDLFLFFLFFEMVLVPMYFLIGGWGYENRVYATLKFFVYTMAGSAFLFVSIVTLVVLEARTTHHLTFDIQQLTANMNLAESTARWLFLGFAVAFAVKVPLFPLHTWLPDAHTEAPTGGSVILAGVMLKLGTYGLLRFGVTLFPEAARHYGPLLLTLALIGMTYGAIVAAVQKDLKRLVAYSSVAHLGFIVLGTFALTSQGMTGGVLQMVNHGLSTGALFLLVGWIYERRHTRAISELNGLQKVAPWMAAIFTVVMLSSIGLPGLNGFVGEFLIMVGTFLTHRWWAVIGATGVIFATVYLVWAYQRTFHGEPTGDNATMPDMTWRERGVIVPLLVFIVFIGVYPKPLLDRIQPSVNQVITHVEQQTNYHQPAVAASQGAQP